jgi:hypothetical protein
MSLSPVALSSVTTWLLMVAQLVRLGLDGDCYHGARHSMHAAWRHLVAIAVRNK